MSISKFQFIGNLTRDTEYNPEGNAPAIFTVAVDASHKKNGVKVEETDFFRIKCFDQMAANAAKYLGKGSLVYVEGRIKPTVFERTPGNKEYGFDFIATFIDYLDTKEPGNN